MRKYVVRREIKKGDKTFYKAPKIQRLITEQRLRRKRTYKKEKQDRFKKEKEARAKYDKVLSQYIKEKRVQHHKIGHEDVKEVAPLVTKPVATGSKPTATAAPKSTGAAKTTTTAAKTDVTAKTNVAAKTTAATKTVNVTASAKVTTQASK